LPSAQQAFGVTPDLCALGKIVGGGLPLAAVAGRRDVLDLSVPGRGDPDRFVHLNGTLNGNPLSAAAGLATLDVLVEEDGPARLRAVGEKLSQGFRDAAASLSIPFQMIGPPAFAEPIFGAGPVTDFASYSATNRKAAQRFGVELLKRGVFCHPASKMYVSVAHDDALIAATCEAAREAMRVVRDEGLLQEASCSASFQPGWKPALR
jgi:glutamate-1-semialdehyde 2,1-aminomutase